MEAENFLASGFASRAAIISQPTGWEYLSKAAKVWQPSRLKGIQVSPDYGSPFLAATQVFDVRPVPRKWLSLERTMDNSERFVAAGTILLTCSGSVGRATLATSSIADTLVSHDLLRIQTVNPLDWGWVYAYLRSPTVRAIMASAQYGHMIKHLEVEHLNALPIVMPSKADIKEYCNELATSILQRRDAARQSMADAELAFTKLIGTEHTELGDAGESGFSCVASETLFRGRRRFDAYRHNPARARLDSILSSRSERMETISQAGCSVWLPNRFKRVPAEDGVDLIDSSSIFEINPDFNRRISSASISDRNGGFVKDGWLLMSRSGQVYGLLGSVAMATPAYSGKVVTDDIIRVKAGEEIDAGYLLLTLNHETLGRPRVKSIAYGSSIPHIEVEDLKALEIPRFDQVIERRLGKLVTNAYVGWQQADQMEIELSEIAELTVASFVSSLAKSGAGNP